MCRSQVWRCRGFTLLELLVALAIFSIMSAMAYGGLRSVLTAREHADQAASDLAQLQFTFLLLQQDLNQAIVRPVRDEFGDQEPAFTTSGDDGVIFSVTRGGAGLSATGNNSGLQRVSYRVTDGVLERQAWQVLDRVQSSESSSLALLPDLLDVSLRYLGEGWSTNWPISSQLDQAELPRAVEVTIITERWGNVQRLFLVSP